MIDPSRAAISASKSGHRADVVYMIEVRIGARFQFWGGASGTCTKEEHPWIVVNSLPRAGTVAAVASTSQALRKWLLKSQICIRRNTALEKATVECVATGIDCLRHCLGMYKMKDTSMAGCADTAFPDQGQKVTGLGGSQAKTNKQYSGQIQAILAAAPPSEP
jgi:hypothetical protein